LRENFDRFNFAIHKEKEMADFRRCFLAIAVLVLAIGFVAPASAQVTTFQCVANAAVPPTMRAEGITELIGDIVLNCTGGVPTPVGAPIPTANVTVFLPESVTSRITQTATSLVDALLLIDEPSASQQKVCPVPTNPAPSGAASDPPVNCVATQTVLGASFATNGDYNVYQGSLTGANAVTFLGIPIDAPATAGAPARVYRVTNIRTNASAYPNAGTGTTIVPVIAYVSISGNTSVPITNAQPTVGFIAPGLVYNSNHSILTTAGTLTGFLQCESYDQTVQTVTFTENFATAFKIRDSGTTTGGQTVPGAIYDTESGLVVPDTVPGATVSYFGNADMGTRLKITFAYLPHGVTLTVPPTLTDSVGGTAVLVSSNNASVGYDAVADSSDFGGPTALTDGTLTINYLTTGVNSGIAAAVYEVTAANPAAVDSFAVPITISFTGAPGTPGLPDIGSVATLTGSFAPTAGGSAGPPTTTTPPTTAGSFTLPAGDNASAEPTPIPRFIDNTVWTNVFSVSLCQTILLFPYVTDFPGFDTGIAISNTSADPLLSLGASPQSGACTVTFYGGVMTGTAPTATFMSTATNIGMNVPGTYSTNDPTVMLYSTGLLGPGQTWAFSLSNADTTLGTSTFTGFSGYAIATCQFQFAHGYAFISNIDLGSGEGGFAASYLPLIIPDSSVPRAPTPNVCSAVAVAGIPVTCFPTGEQLVH
jgi:hypothetical protein